MTYCIELLDVSQLDVERHLPKMMIWLSEELILSPFLLADIKEYMQLSVLTTTTVSTEQRRMAGNSQLPLGV